MRALKSAMNRGTAFVWSVKILRCRTFGQHPAEWWHRVNPHDSRIFSSWPWCEHESHWSQERAAYQTQSCICWYTTSSYQFWSSQPKTNTNLPSSRGLEAGRGTAEAHPLILLRVNGLKARSTTGSRRHSTVIELPANTSACWISTLAESSVVLPGDLIGKSYGFDIRAFRPVSKSGLIGGTAGRW